MAKYPSITTTKAGLNAISESNASGKALIFTGLLIGSGETPTDIKGLTALVAPRLKIEDITITNNGDGECTIRGALVNTTLDSGFYAKEIGVLAKVGEEGEEILFSYTNGGNYVDYIPDKSTVMDTYTFTITTVVGNAENITVFVNNDGYATLDDLNDHNEFEGAHRNLFINATDDAEATNNSDKGATTSWVINKLQKFKSFTSSQISDFKEKVIEIITENIVNILQITYRLDSNGFIKFGLFGGFTIQWGLALQVPINANPINIKFPISMGYLWSNCTICSYDVPNVIISPYISSSDGNSINVVIDYEIGQGYSGIGQTTNVLWIAIGIG